MALKSDYWQMPATLSACTGQLHAALPSPTTITAADLCNLLTLLPGQLLAQVHADWKQLVSKALMQLLGNVRVVITSERTREQFLQPALPCCKAVGRAGPADS